MTRWLFALAVLAACQDPPLQIVYQVATDGDGASCPATSCEELPMACDAVLFLRVLSPSDPTVPYVSVCEPVPPDPETLCAISRIDLDPIDLPRESLEIQVTVWPRELVTNPATGELDCQRTQVQFDAVNGFPTTLGPSFGGRAFYQPGDAETVVTLGCTDLEAINAPTCTGEDNVDVHATVLDFENLPLLVTGDTGDRLSVAIGEPRDSVLEFADTRQLPRTVQDPPAWGAPVDLMFTSTACIQVLEDNAQATASVRCKPVDAEDRTLDLAGVRVPKPTLDEILRALALQVFPDEGMTIGIVVDQNGNPVAGATVNATAGTIEYLDATRTGLAPGGKTTSSGIFISRDAPFGTVFSVMLTPSVASQIGGRVQGKLTVIHFDAAQIGG